MNGHDLDMCVHSPERQTCPGLHPKHGQQSKGGGSAPVFHCHSNTPGVLCSDQGPPAQERHRFVRDSPGESYEEAQRTGTSLL